MPIALDAAELAEYVLPFDRDKSNPPTFLFSHLTRRQHREVAALMEQARQAEDDEPFEAALDKAIRIGLRGWKNLRGADGAEIPYSPDALDDVLTPSEKIEMATGYAAAVTTVEAKKKQRSGSASTSPTGPSAPDAPAGSAPTPRP